MTPAINPASRNRQRGLVACKREHLSDQGEDPRPDCDADTIKDQPWQGQRPPEAACPGFVRCAHEAILATIRRRANSAIHLEDGSICATEMAREMARPRQDACGADRSGTTVSSHMLIMSSNPMKAKKASTLLHTMPVSNAMFSVGASVLATSAKSNHDKKLSVFDMQLAKKVSATRR